MDLTATPALLAHLNRALDPALIAELDAAPWDDDEVCASIIAMPLTSAEKIRNAATMYGTGSRQHLAAITRFTVTAKKKTAKKKK